MHIVRVFLNVVIASTTVFAPVVLSQQLPDTTRLPKVEVTATRLPASSSFLTASVTTLQGEDLRSRGIRFVQDALRDVPGIAVVRTGSYGGVTSLFLRGGESDYVKVLIDGVPVNLAGGSFNWASLTTDNLDRIEIVRGPASVLYGADAMTGVIQLFTRRGAQQLTANVDSEAGTFGSTRVRGSVAGGTRGGVGYSAALGRVATDGIYPFNNRFRNTTATASFRTNPFAATRLVATARYADAVHHFPTDFAGVPSDSNQFGSEERFSISTDLARTLSQSLEGRLLVSGSRATIKAHDDPDSPGDSLGFGFESRRRLQSSRILVDGRVNAGVGRSTLTFGTAVEAEYEELTARSRSNFGDGESSDSSTFDADRTTVAGYAQAVLAIGPAVGVQAGVRVDDNTAFGTFLTARLGLTGALLPTTHVRASIGSAFKAPTFTELRARTPFEIGNPDLRPERSVSIEAGVRHEAWARRLALDVALFAQRFRDVIQYRFTSANEPTYFNLARARSLGFEVAGQLHPTSWANIELSYTRTATKVTDAGASMSVGFVDGRTLLRRPSHTGRMGLSLTGARVSGQANVRVVGARDDVDFRSFPEERVSLPRYATVDLAGTWALARQVILKARVENLFDERYESVVGFRAPGRALFAGVDLRVR